MFTASPVFSENYKLSNLPLNECKIIVNQGGTWSGKTYSIMQLLFLIAITNSNKVITIIGQDIPNLKKGAIRDSKRIIQDTEGLNDYIESYNTSDRIYKFKNGSIMEFNSCVDKQSAKSGKRDYLFINEANGISYEIAWELMIRTDQKVFIDYNPNAKFWVHENILIKDNAKLIISDHRHNPFISKQQHEEIEGIDDKELWKVYARGMTGMIHGLILPKYTLIDSIPASVKTWYGLDFGFNHKMALVECGKLDNRIFTNELIYRSEMTTGELIGEMKELSIGRTTPIFADSARPDAIKEIRQAGFNCLMADKSVIDGLNYIKKHQHYITRSSIGYLKEIQHYKWQEKNGIILDQPVKFLDDAIDASRYGHYSARNGVSNNMIVANPGALSWSDLLGG